MLNEKKFFKIVIAVLSLTFIFLKIYLILINKVNFGSFAYSANTFIYYNTRAFSEIPQSFHDWNHPGTPIYYVTFLLSSIFLKNLNVENFQNFINLHHIFITIFTVLVLNYSAIKLRKYLSQIEIFFSFLFLFSFYSFVHTLEVVDPTNYLFPFSLLIVIQTIELMNNPVKLRKRLIYFSLISSLAISIKMSLLPLVLMSSLVVIIELRKKIKESLIFICLLFFSFVMFNLPILGRMPRVIYTILFVRSDTRFSFDEIFLYKITKLFQLIAFQNIFLLIMIFIFTVIIIINSKKVFRYYENKNFVYSVLIFLCFLYTLFSANDEINIFDKYDRTGFFLRNCYFNSVFIIPLLIGFFEFRKSFFWVNFKLIFFLFIFLSFASNLLFYFDYRNQKNINIIQKKERFNLEIDKLIPESSLIAIYGDSGYSFENEMFHFIGNSLFAGEKFNHDLINSFENLRFFRLHDFIVNNFADSKLKPQSNLMKNKNLAKKRNLDSIKEVIYGYDNYLKENLPYYLYLILSHNSHKLTSSFPGQKKRSRDLFLKNQNENINYVIFNENNMILKEFNISGLRLINKLNQFLNIISINEFQIYDDKWFILKLN